MTMRNRGSKPNFLLTRKVEITVIRPGAFTIVNGRKVVGEPSTHFVEGNIQPLKYSELMLMPESDRTKEWYKIFLQLDQDIRGAREGSDGWEADFIEWEGDTYKVMRHKLYKMGVLDHQECHVARTPISAGY